jgi:hypothetical protein
MANIPETCLNCHKTGASTVGCREISLVSESDLKFIPCFNPKNWQRLGGSLDQVEPQINPLIRVATILGLVHAASISSPKQRRQRGS